MNHCVNGFPFARLEHEFAVQRTKTKVSGVIDLADGPFSSNWVNWVKRVHEPLSEKEIDAVRWSIKRRCPFGNETWVESTHVVLTWNRHYARVDDQANNDS